MLNILFVDDNLNEILGTIDSLDTLKFNVHQANSSIEALNILSKNRDISVVVTDYLMPNCKGTELCKKIKDRYDDVEVILLTAYGLEYMSEAFMNGAFWYLVKTQYEPLEMETLLTRADQHCKFVMLKRNFLRTISHEINTPLNIILPICSDLESEISSKDFSHDELIESMSLLNENMSRLKSTLDLIQEITMVNSYEYSINRDQNFILNDLLIKIIKKINNRKNKKPLSLKMKLPDTDTSIIGDDLILERIFTEVLDNSIKFSKQGEIFITCELKGNHYHIGIVDQGIGISSNFLPFIWDEFSKESQNSSQIYDGLGLGLNLVKKLCQLYGIEKRVESNKNMGSTFMFVIPQSIEIKK